MNVNETLKNLITAQPILNGCAVTQRTSRSQEERDREIVTCRGGNGNLVRGVKLRKYPAASNFITTIRHVSEPETNDGYFMPENVQVHGNVVWIPELRAKDFYIIGYVAETWQDRARRLWRSKVE